MNNGTCCALKLHAKSQLNSKIIRDKYTSCLVERYNRKYFLYTFGCRQRFAGLPSMNAARIFAARHYAAGRTR